MKNHTKEKLSENAKKKNEKTQVLISAILGNIFLFTLIVACFYVPRIVDIFISIPHNDGLRGQIGSIERGIIIADLYLMISVGVGAVILMFKLLKTVLNGDVFTKTTCKLLSLVSTCCFIEGALSLFFVLYFKFIICIFLAAWFLGLCLRVVKNVIEEATRIKEENDFTV